MTYYSFGRNLKKARKAKKMSQQELADKIGVTQQAISYYEKDEKYPTIDKIYDLARVLEIQVFDLVQ